MARHSRNVPGISGSFYFVSSPGYQLVIGLGPIIYQLLAASESFEIIASDYTDESLLEQKKWLKEMPGAFGWSPMVQYLRELEGNRQATWEELRPVNQAPRPCGNGHREQQEASVLCQRGRGVIHKDTFSDDLPSKSVN
ncbi:Nicotinamide N-methyltransferase [Tupaia chinensis]|uniref:Nicotinamide N-methyltransferase n=1 Tax=Tupaia chinensis TaxID=246437 RepID=L9KP71_TUPCH|nr:Nicotinamide N-methyltransferase [Tupaia chinensis]